MDLQRGCEAVEEEHTSAFPFCFLLLFVNSVDSEPDLHFSVLGEKNQTSAVIDQSSLVPSGLPLSTTDGFFCSDVNI